jgi:hypothetical protein
VHEELLSRDPVPSGTRKAVEVRKELGAVTPIRLVQAPQPLECRIRAGSIHDPKLRACFGEPASGPIDKVAHGRVLIEKVVESRRQWRKRRGVERREPNRRGEGVDDVSAFDQSDKIDDARTRPREPNTQRPSDLLDP